MITALPVERRRLLRPVVLNTSFALLAAALTLIATGARAQDTTGPTVPRPDIRGPDRIVPPKPPIYQPPITNPAEPRNTEAGSSMSLSERLDRNDGVLTPPPVGTPLKQVEPPAPHPNTTPVIPPPGTPRNPSPVEPK